MIRKRKICWPDPDATCLQGGCSYCNAQPYMLMADIQDWAMKAGQLHNRGNLETQDALDALNWFIEHPEYSRADYV